MKNNDGKTSEVESALICINLLGANCACFCPLEFCWTQGRDLPCLQWHNSNTHFEEQGRNKGTCQGLRGFYLREGYVSCLFIFKDGNGLMRVLEWNG